MTTVSRSVFLLLGICSAVILLQRIHARAEPLESDTALFSVLAQEWRQGRPLYSDLWDNKPPGLMLTYATAQAAVGQGPRSILLLGSFASILTLFGLYATAIRMTGDRRAGVWAAIFWALINATPYLEANQPLAEVFVNACWVWAAAWGFRAVERGTIWDFFRAGSFLAMASFYKHHLVIADVAFVLGIAGAGRTTNENPRALLRTLFWLALPTIILWASTFGYFTLTHRFRALWETLVISSRYYAAGSHPGLAGWLSNLLDSVRPSIWHFLMARGVFYILAPLAAGALPAIVAAIFLKDRRWIAWSGYAAAAWIGLTIPGHFFPHYYQVLLPPLVLAAGALPSLLERFSGIRHPRLLTVLPTAFATLLLFKEAAFYRLSPEDCSRLKYGEVYITIRKMGEEIDRNLPPGETFYELGCEAGLYYYSQRRPPTGILMSDHWDSGPLQASFMERIRRDLLRKAPLLLVTTRFWLANKELRQLPLAQWCFERYQELPQDSRHGPFVLFIRRDRLLEARKASRHSHQIP